MKTTLSDPRELYPKPPFPETQQKAPGVEAKMQPLADHGEDSYEGKGLLKGRRALITGGDSGIGRAVAIAFAREGADVAISYLSEEKDAQETSRLITAAGRKSLLLPGDLASADVCHNILDRTVAELGGLDILVNNAAYQRTYDDPLEIPEDEFEEAFQVNVFAMFRLCKRALPHLPAGGSIINTASIQGYDPSGGLNPYAATKAAILNFTLSMAELAMEHGVRVNAVAPGPVWTPLIPATCPPEKVAKFGANTVFGRPAQPAELAPIFVFLASPAASYVTGETYGATGGRTPV